MFTYLLDADDFAPFVNEGEDQSIEAVEIKSMLPLPLSFKRVTTEPGHAPELIDIVSQLDNIDSCDVAAPDRNPISPLGFLVIFVLLPQFTRSKLDFHLVRAV